jgi:hypothetical protein
VAFVLLGNRRKGDHLPRLMFEHVPDKVVLVQPLHDQDDAAVLLVIEPTEQAVVVPFVHRLALRIGERLIGLEGVIDNNDVAATAGQNATHGGGEAEALTGRHKFLDGLLLRRQTGGKKALVKGAGHHSPAVAGVLVREFLAVADTDDLGRRIMPEPPSRQRNRSA